MTLGEQRGEGDPGEGWNSVQKVGMTLVHQYGYPMVYAEDCIECVQKVGMTLERP